MEKINEQVKRELGKMILMGDINDPRVKLVTIMSVDISKDLQHARVRFSVLNDDPKVISNAQQGLNSCCGFIRKLIGQRLSLRYTPEFQFIFDKGVQYAAHIDAALEEIKKITPHQG
ncbi:MAG: 30S ribosome-binding factor RbfA [Candidatus Omnitrophica bacterium]|nr:30S ribosome-binding factor RbfA [Candidatus Omnitrophota bacterium]